jgi:hypothetical protein
LIMKKDSEESAGNLFNNEPVAFLEAGQEPNQHSHLLETPIHLLPR